jgi:hypothetical protein
MKQPMKSIFKSKKVELSDVASPKPSRAATRVLNGALKRAYDDQKAVSRKAEAIRSGS